MNEEEINANGMEKYKLVEKFLYKINKKILNGRKFSNFLVIDEGMCSFQGRCRYKQFLKLKKRKWGLKFFEIVDKAFFISIENSKIKIIILISFYQFMFFI